MTGRSQSTRMMILFATSTILLVSAQLIASKSIITEPPLYSSSSSSSSSSSRNEAIIFVPGDGGSQLEARLNKTNRVHYFCSLTSDWFDLWLNLHLLSPIEFACFSDNMQLLYNATTRKTSNSEGVDVRPTKYGYVDSVAYLNIWNLKGTDYFETIVGTLEKAYNFKRNLDMFGAPYDFRKAPNELDEFVANFTYQSQNWRDVMIKRVISLAAPWHGSFKAISTMMFGDDLGIPILFKFSRQQLQALQKTFPSLMYLFPREPTFDANKILVQTPSANYTLKTLDKLFAETNLTDQREMWHDVRSIANNIKPPNVELWCLYGNQPKSTPTKLVLDEPYEKFSYQEELGDGDGTVNIESLRACESFASQQQKPVYTREFPGLDHVDILKNPIVSDFIVSHIFNSSMQWNRILAS